MKHLSKIIILAISLLTISSCSVYQKNIKSYLLEKNKSDVKVSYDDEGKITSAIPFKDGKRNGIGHVYLFNKDINKYYLAARVTYKNDKKHGKLYLYGAKGHNYSITEYKNGLEVARWYFDKDKGEFKWHPLISNDSK